MLPRVLEPEVMDSAEEARDYDSMDHREVNAKFVTDFLAVWQAKQGEVLDVGSGTAQIPIELAKRHAGVRITAIDLAQNMLDLGTENVARAGVQDRIRLLLVDAKALPFANGAFGAVISNSIVHHLPEPRLALAEMTRVCQPDGVIFVRDLARPEDDASVRRLVDLYAHGANAHQRQLFDQSLRAALRLEELRAMIASLGFDPTRATMTSDRHWTWATSVSR